MAGTGAPESGLSASVLDALADDFGDGAGEVIADLMATYLDEGTHHLDDLGAAVDAGDTVASRRLAHSLKSSSAALGALLLAELLARLERVTDPTELQADWQQVQLEYRVVERELVAYPGRPTPAG